MRLSVITATVLLSFFLPRSVYSQNAIPYSVVGSGWGGSSGGSYYLFATLGQPSIGVLSGASNGGKIGYWYVVDALHIGPTSEVVVSTLGVEVVEEGVMVRWEIGEGSAVLGFNVYRSSKERGGFERLNVDVLAPERRSYIDGQALPGEAYYYKIGAVDKEGEFYSPVGRVEVPPREMELYQNYPNPFNPLTTISFYLPRSERASVVVYDASGHVVRRLYEGVAEAGRHDLTWDGRDEGGVEVGSGVYFYRLTAGKKVMTRKLTLVK